MNRQAGRSVELLLILFVALLLIVGVIVWGLLPAMQNERTSQQQLERLQQQTAKLTKEYGVLFEAKQRQTAERRDDTAALPPVEKVRAWLQGFIASAQIETMPDGRLHVECTIDSPVQLYQALDALENEPWNLRAVLPLKMEAAKEGIKASWDFAPAGGE